MKKIVSSTLFIATIASMMLIYSCKKKEDSSTTNTTLDASSAKFNDDANFYKGENDQLNDDVNQDLGNHPGMRLGEGGNRFQSFNPPCGSTVDTTFIAQKKLIYTFDGTTNCYGRKRSGTVVVELTKGNKWSDVGAELTFTTTNYKVTRIYDGKSVTIRGTKKLSNDNGFNWATFFTGTGTIKYTERALGVLATFDSGLQATWNSAVTAEWSFNPNTYVYSFRCNGDTAISGTNNVSAWGTNRFGNAFVTHYTAPIVCNSICAYSKPMSGQLIHNVNNATFTLTLGVDQNGNAYSGSACPFGYKIAWVLGNGGNGTANLPYN